MNELDKRLLDLATARAARPWEENYDLEKKLWDLGYIHRADLTALLQGIHDEMAKRTPEEALAFLRDRIEKSRWRPSRISGWV